MSGAPAAGEPLRRGLRDLEARWLRDLEAFR